MKSAHPRSPGGRQDVYSGRDAQPKPGTYSKFMPVKQVKIRPAVPKKEGGEKA